MSSLRPGDCFGSYRILDVLGRGATSIVYRAREPRWQRDVALKVMTLVEEADADDLARFRLQAEIGRRLTHPHLARVLDSGEVDEIGAGGASVAIPYVTSECYAGTLSDCIGKYRANPREAALLVLDMAEAVAFLHDHGLLHRDLKPSNILLDRLDGTGHACVADLGLAKIVGSAPRAESSAPRGCLENMAPELFSSGCSAAAPPADIYSLGTILYEMLVGAPTYEGLDEEVLSQLMSRDPVPSPSSRGVSVPSGLEDICMECLEKRPGLRFDSANAFADALKVFLKTGGRPKRSWAARFYRYCLRHPRAASFAAGAIPVTLVSTALGAWAMDRHEQALQQQVLAANQYAAQASAGQVLLVLRSLADRLLDCAARPEVISVLDARDGPPVREPGLESVLRDCAPPSIFDSAVVLDAATHPVTRIPYLRTDYELRDFAFRDYLIGAQRAARRRLAGALPFDPAQARAEAVYVGRPHISESDLELKFSLAVPVFSRPDAVGYVSHVGYLMTTLGTDSTIESLTFRDLEDPRRTGALVGLRDRERVERDGPLPKQFVVLVHEGLRHGQTVKIDSPALASIESRIAGEDPEKRHQFQMPLRRGNEQSNDHRDPMSGFEGRWLAAFERVGETDYVVIVQTRYDAIDAVKSWLWRVVGAAALLTLGFVVLFMRTVTRRRRREFFSS